MELSELKRNREMLLSVLGATKIGKHLPCPFHGGGDSFSIWQGKDGCWLWKCNSSGCGTGTVLDAAMKVYRVPSVVEACRAMEAQLGIKIIRDEDYHEPQINHEVAEAFVTDAHEYLMSSAELQDKWLNKKRGIYNLDTVKKYRLGFVTPDRFKFGSTPRVGKTSKPWTWNLFGWVLPITNADGMLMAVKLHTEKALFTWAPTKSPKCVWAPFGTYPGTEPKDGCATLWPPPEHFQGAEKLYICPGELKALAMIGAGMAATSPTAGESTLRPELVRRIIRAKPQKTFITFDDDAPKMVAGKWVSAGNAWKDGVIRALKGEGMLCYAFAFGKKKEAPIPLQDETDEKQTMAANAEAVETRAAQAPIEHIPTQATRATADECMVTEHATAADLAHLDRFSAPRTSFERKNILEE